MDRSVFDITHLLDTGNYESIIQEFKNKKHINKYSYMFHKLISKI